MKFKLIVAAFLLASFGSCKKSEVENETLNKTGADSFMPLQIGNYWRMNDQNYTEVQDTARIKGELFYKVYSLVGGDAISQKYYRLTEDQVLISSSPSYPDYQYTEAKFNANVGDTFQTLGDQSVNDYKVTVVEKTDSKITFSFDMIYHPNLNGHPHTVTYIKGLGWNDAWKSVRIDGEIISR